MAGYWPSSFMRTVFMDVDEVEVDKNTKNNEVKIQLSWPNKLAWSIRNLFMDKKRTFLAGPTHKDVQIFWP